VFKSAGGVILHWGAADPRGFKTIGKWNSLLWKKRKRKDQGEKKVVSKPERSKLDRGRKSSAGNLGWGLSRREFWLGGEREGYQKE